MRFALTDEQRDFAGALDELLAASDTCRVARAWAAGDTGPGLQLWTGWPSRGCPLLATDASAGRAGVAFEALGRYAVPGPWVEAAAYLPVLLGRELDEVATVAVAPHVPLALDADIADIVFVVTGGPRARGRPSEGRRSTRSGGSSR